MNKAISPAGLVLPLESRRLWSLWDMLEAYAALFVRLFDSIRALEWDLGSKATQDGTLVSPDPSGVTTPLGHALSLADSLALDLGMASSRRQIRRVFQMAESGALLIRLLPEIKQLRVRLEEDLGQKQFAFVPDDLAAIYDHGGQRRFGELPFKKFKAAREDIANAGNCLALQQPMACIFHLMRAMEVALRQLGKKLHVTINPKDTWGQILKNIDPKIEAMPEKTERQKKKKEQWSQARANLFHVKSAWRDNSLHAKRATATPAQAKEIYDAVKTFMTNLASL